MKVGVTRRGASWAAHKMHFLFHAGYLVAASLEGHLMYSLMAGGTLVFMLGCAVLGDEH